VITLVDDVGHRQAIGLDRIPDHGEVLCADRRVWIEHSEVAGDHLIPWLAGIVERPGRRGLPDGTEEVVPSQVVQAVEYIYEVGLPHLGAPLEDDPLKHLDGEAVPLEPLGGRVTDGLDTAEPAEL
jgi:hypothetical protein